MELDGQTNGQPETAEQAAHKPRTVKGMSDERWDAIGRAARRRGAGIADFLWDCAEREIQRERGQTGAALQADARPLLDGADAGGGQPVPARLQPGGQLTDGQAAGAMEALIRAARSLAETQAQPGNGNLLSAMRAELIRLAKGIGAG